MITLLDVAFVAACHFDGLFTVFCDIYGLNSLQKRSSHICHKKLKKAQWSSMTAASTDSLSDIH